MAQTAAQKKAAADLAKLKAAIAKTQARVTQNDAALDAAEKAATASRRAVIDTAPATPAQSGKYLGEDGNYYNSPVEAALGRDIGKSVTQPTAAARIATATTIRKTGTADNPIPYAPPAGANWNLYSGVWKLYYAGSYIGDASGYDTTLYDKLKNPVVTKFTNNPNNPNDPDNPADPDNPDTTIKKVIDPTGPSTNITVLKSLLKGMGFNSSIIDSSTSFLMSLLAEDLDYDNAVSIFLDSKDYTLKSGVKVTSPFYEQYGYLNEGMTNAKSASELYNFVEGSKGIIEKYGLSSKFLSQDSLKKYVKNNVTAKDLDERANAARLKAINADPLYVQSLKMLGYLGSNADLTDFYLDPAIGKEKLESNRSTGAFTTEALRRANAGIKTDREDMMRFEKLTAGLQAKGLTEAEISQTASTGFQNIANTLQPSVALSNIFEGANAANAQTIQTELEAEEFLGLDSARRKKLKELGTNIMQAKTGMNTGRTVSYSNYSSAGQI